MAIKKTSSRKKKKVDELKGDPEFAEFLNALEMDGRLSWLCRMRKVISWKKQHRGLEKVKVISYDPKKTGPEEVARGFFMLQKSIAAGRVEDVTDEPLRF